MPMCWQALATSCHASLLRSLLRIADHTARLDLAGDSRHGGQREAEVCARSPSAQPPEFASRDLKVCAQEKAALQTVSVRLQQAAFWFVGENAPTLCAAACGGNGMAPEPDLLLRLQHGATFSPWEVRATCAEALGKLALRSIASEDAAAAARSLVRPPRRCSGANVADDSLLSAQRCARRRFTSSCSRRATMKAWGCRWSSRQSCS